MSDILEIRNISKEFKETKAVDNISLNIRENTVFGLLGPNGAGKSTLLKMITGIIKPSSGRILVNGEKWTRDCLEIIGALIENPPIYDNLSATENLKVKALQLDIKDERIEEVLRIVGLTNTGKKKAGQFSLGMKQRLGIALALLNYPKILILDEPTNGLDPIGIEELRELIKTFPSMGITVILSSHILSEVSQVADDIAIISNGHLGYCGENNPDKDLEELFMKVVRENRGGEQ